MKVSPIFYMGNKYKLLKQMLPLFPETCRVFIDAFGGSGVVTMNYRGGTQVYNEINPNVIGLINMILTTDLDELNTYYLDKIQRYNLRTKSNKKHPELNAEGFYQLRKEYNSSANKEYKDLFLLLCYSMNHLLHFNKNNEFNASNGNDSYNEKNFNQLQDFKECFQGVKIMNKNVFDINFDILGTDDFIYFDPPYFNTEAVYNEKRAFGGWDINCDFQLYEICDKLTQKGIKWALSNVFVNRGKENTHLIKWCEDRQYAVSHLNRNYNPFSRGNSNNDEVLIMNYTQDGNIISI